MTVLLDGNVLIAMTVAGHVHHDAAARWFAGSTRPHATTPITQGSLIRTVIRLGATAAEGVGLLDALTMAPGHVFWPDAVPYTEAILSRVAGHADVTDAYLAELARYHGGRLATFDRRLAVLHPDVADVIPV